MISLFYFSSTEFHFLFFSVSQMAADVCENINVEFSVNINILLTDKYSISILHLAKCLMSQVSQMAADVCENINVTFSVNINIV